MAYVISEGEGTYTTCGWKFKPGATPVPDDDPVLKDLEGWKPPWITVQETRDAVETPIPEPEPVEREPYETFKGRDGKWYFLSPAGRQSQPFDDQAEAEAVADAEQSKIPLAEDLAAEDLRDKGGKMTLDEVLPSGTIDCRHPGCDRKGERGFRNKGAEANHSRVKHPELFKP